VTERKNLPGKTIYNKTSLFL